MPFVSLVGPTTYPANAGDDIVANATAGVVTVTLPDASMGTPSIMVKKTDASSNAVLVVPASNEVMHPTTAGSITATQTSFEYVTDGPSWHAFGGAAGAGSLTQAQADARYVLDSAISSYQAVIAIDGTPQVGDGFNGDLSLNRLTGDVWGRKAAGAWPSTPQTTLALQRVFDVKYYGAKGNGVLLTSGGAVTATGTAYTNTTAAFTTADVGKQISIAGAGTAGDIFNTTIAAYVSATAVTLTAAAVTTVTTAITQYGTDDTTAIQAAVAAAFAAGGGIVFVPTGRYVFTATITWVQRGVSLIGQGIGRSVFVPIGVDFGAIRRSTTEGAGTGSLTTDCDFQDFELDGSCMTNTGYTSQKGKGLEMPYNLRCRATRVYVHDTMATGIAFDYPYESHNTDCITYNCGRSNGGSNPGGNGFGHGVLGSADVESLIMTGCIALNSGRVGILFEAQNGHQATESTGCQVVNCYVSGNPVGIENAGIKFLNITGNVVTGNTVAGIVVGNGTFGTPFPGFEGLIASNQIYLNTGPGILLDYTFDAEAPTGKHVITGNNISFNTGEGILAQTHNVVMGVILITDNTVHDNGLSGIRATVTSGGTGTLSQGSFSANRVYNNGSLATTNNRDGIRVDLASIDLNVRDNVCFDRQGTKKQGYGVVTSAVTYTGGSIVDNDLRNNLTGGMNFGTAVSATTHCARNAGGTHAAPTLPSVTASPMTYTAPTFPVWLSIVGGVVTAVTVAGVSVATGTNVQLTLESADAVVITYSSAPTLAIRGR